MARHPEWFERLEVILEVVRRTDQLDWFGRKEMGAVFCCGERDSIRLLHKFGAVKRDDALALPRSALLAQLEAVRRGSVYAAFLRQRRELAKQLSTAREEAVARQFRVRPVVGRETQATRFQDLPVTVTWRRERCSGPGRFEILYHDGADLMWQLSEFLAAAAINRDEFVAATAPSDEPAH
jgi:hypothetical protein